MRLQKNPLAKKVQQIDWDIGPATACRRLDRVNKKLVDIGVKANAAIISARADFTTIAVAKALSQTHERVLLQGANRSECVEICKQVHEVGGKIKFYADPLKTDNDFDRLVNLVDNQIGRIKTVLCNEPTSWPFAGYTTSMRHARMFGEVARDFVATFDLMHRCIQILVSRPASIVLREIGSGFASNSQRGFLEAVAALSQELLDELHSRHGQWLAINLVRLPICQFAAGAPASRNPFAAEVKLVTDLLTHGSPIINGHVWVVGSRFPSSAEPPKEIYPGSPGPKTTYYEEMK